MQTSEQKKKIKLTAKEAASVKWGLAVDFFAIHVDSKKRHEATDSTPQEVAGYMRRYREPSRAWPYSRIKPILTTKFEEWLALEDPELHADYMAEITPALADALLGKRGELEKINRI